MMMDVIYRLDHPRPLVYYRASVSQSQSQSSLVPPPVCLSVCRSCPLSFAVWLPCWADYLRIPTLHSLQYAAVLGPRAGWACQA